MDSGTVVWNDHTSPLGQSVRDDNLADIEPNTRKLNPRNMESMFVDYYHDEAADTIEMAAFQARHDQLNTTFSPT